MNTMVEQTNKDITWTINKNQKELSDSLSNMKEATDTQINQF
jgi:hypothetical protein